MSLDYISASAQIWSGIQKWFWWSLLCVTSSLLRLCLRAFLSAGSSFLVMWMCAFMQIEEVAHIHKPVWFRGFGRVQKNSFPRKSKNSHAPRHVILPLRCVNSVHKITGSSTGKLWMLTIPPHHHRRWRAEHCGVGHHVSHHTRVVSSVWRFNFGYVQVACLLRDKTTGILLQEAPLSIENPWIFDFWKKIVKKLFYNFFSR